MSHQLTIIAGGTGKIEVPDNIFERCILNVSIDDINNGEVIPVCVNMYPPNIYIITDPSSNTRLPE